MYEIAKMNLEISVKNFKKGLSKKVIKTICENAFESYLFVLDKNYNHVEENKVKKGISYYVPFELFDAGRSKINTIVKDFKFWHDKLNEHYDYFTYDDLFNLMEFDKEILFGYLMNSSDQKLNKTIQKMTKSKPSELHEMFRVNFNKDIIYSISDKKSISNFCRISFLNEETMNILDSQKQNIAKILYANYQESNEDSIKNEIIRELTIEDDDLLYSDAFKRICREIRYEMEWVKGVFESRYRETDFYIFKKQINLA